MAVEIIGASLSSMPDIYKQKCREMALCIVKDPNHPVNRVFQLLPSGKRYDFISAKD